MRNIRCTIQYEGTRYKGWQKQESSENTLQGKLEMLLSRMCSEPVEVFASGRTDAGVHALGQVINFHTSSTMPVKEMLSYMNRYLPEDIGVIAAEEVDNRFHSRLNACGKCYCYQVINSEVPDVFRRRYALEHPQPLNLQKMKQAAELLCGEHDFKAFTSAKKGKKSTVRRIDSIIIEEQNNFLTFTFRGNGFLYHMVRILMGTLLEVGRGERKPESMTALLESKDREKAGSLVPAKGLILVEVYYPFSDSDFKG